MPSQLHLYTIREGTVRYSPFSKELSNFHFYSSLSLTGDCEGEGGVRLVRRSVFVSERHQLVARMEAVCDS